jgi:phosphoglycolate phosphatase
LTLPHIQLVIFDLDGVLLDSRENMQVSWAAVQRAVGTAVPFENYFREIGKPFADIMDVLGLGSVEREAERAYMTASLQQSRLLRWFDGVEPMLTGLQDLGVKLAIVTSKDRQRTVKLVERLPVDFSTVQSPAAGLRGKPAPDHLLIACAHANTDPAQAIFVGDMIVDQQAANRANLDFIFAAWGYGKVVPGSRAELNQPIDILQMVSDS